MASVEFKLEKDLCRCCHCVGSFKNLAEPFKTAVSEEIYWDMLKECFNIDMSPVPDMLNASTNTICDACIIRLQDAADFKKQVLLCEERFKDIYSKKSLKGTITTIEIKEEPVEELPEPDDDFMNPLPQDESDDYFEVAVDMKIIDEEKADEKPANVEVRKKRECRKKTVNSQPVQNKVMKSKAVKSKAVKSKAVKSKAVKSKAVKSNAAQEKNLKEEPADETDAVNKQGCVVPRKFFLEPEHYRKIGEVYHCARCDRKYDKIDSLKSHYRSLHGGPKYKCSFCIEKFRTQARLTVHKLEVHNVDDRVNCMACNKIFNTKVQLRKHINIFHMLGERYKCEFCEYESFSLGGMYKHKFKHKTVKDYHCRFCKKSFLRKTTLDFHERIHTGDRRKVCSVCGQAFVQKASLNYHMTKYHPEVKF